MRSMTEMTPHGIVEFVMDKAIPESDEDAVAMLLGAHPSIASYAAVGIYRVRRRQGLSVFDAYMDTLNRWIAIGEGAIGTE